MSNESVSNESTLPSSEDKPVADQTTAGADQQTSTEPVASDAAPVETSQAAPQVADAAATDAAGSVPETASPETPAKRVAIGSQRDAADKSLKPAQPKAVQAAMANPIDLLGTGEKDIVPELPDIRSDAGFTDDVDAEIEAALGEISMDTVIADAGTSENELEAGTRVKAKVSRIHKDDVFFKLDGQYEGVAALHHFKTPPAEGDEAEIIIRSRSREDGLYELSVPGAAVGVADWDDVNEGDVVHAMVTGSNTGGLEVTVNSLNGFVPASQIARFRVDDFSTYVGQKLQCVVMEVKPEKRKFVLSHRAVMEREQAEKRKQLLEELEVGQFREGTVVKLMDFGAFIDLGGIEGLAHISKLSWSRIKHPSEVVSEGDKVKVKVEKFDPESGKMSLSYRDTLEDPWKTLNDQFTVDDIVKGTVTRVADFGAFVKIAPAIEGLVHISELSYKRVARVSSVVNEGDEIDVKILSIDTDGQKVSLSHKACTAPPAPKAGGKPAAEEADLPARELAVPSSGQPLKGGRDKKSGGESIGLNW